MMHMLFARRSVPLKKPGVLAWLVWDFMHVEALLWKIEYAVRNNMTGVSCTDKAARWNKGTRNIEPKPLVSI
jgi:hypothetical protein